MSSTKIFIAVLMFAGASFASCNKCSTCTYTPTDSTDSVRTSEICSNTGHYDEQLEAYERSNWECVEN